MRSIFLFKTDERYTYSTGVLRGLEPYLLKKADYQKVLDSELDELAGLLSDLGYGGSEMKIEHAFDVATEKLFALTDNLSRDKTITDTLHLRYDFLNSAAILKARLFDGGTVAEFIPFGKIPKDKLMKGIDAICEGEKPDLPDILTESISSAKRFASAINMALAIDAAMDKSFLMYNRQVFPKSEFFERLWQINADFLNMKIFIRLAKMESLKKMFWQFFIPDGTIPKELFKSALETELCNIHNEFRNTEYGIKLSDAVKQAIGGKSNIIDNFFKSRLLALYKYTRYCPYGIEVLWAYANMVLEEIGALRTIVRSRKAGVPKDKIMEVISFAME